MDIRRALVHELSNKVSTLKIMAELKEDCLGEDFFLALQDIDTLVRWMLDVHISEIGKRKEVRINLKELIEDVMDEVSLILRLNRISVRIEACEDLNIVSDDFILKRIMYNLIHNAVKFSPQGSSVTVRCESLKEQIRLIIENQIEESEDKKGSGLGLQITEDLIQCINGSVKFSTSGGKAVTEITLPLK